MILQEKQKAQTVEQSNTALEYIADDIPQPQTDVCLNELLPYISDKPSLGYLVLKTVRKNSLRGWDQLTSDELREARDLFLEEKMEVNKNVQKKVV